MKDQSSLRHAIVSTDVVLFTVQSGVLKTILVTVRNDEYKNMKAFPGGLVLLDETAFESAQRSVTVKTGIAEKDIYLEELKSYSDIGRDRRGRVVSIAYIGLVESGVVEMVLQDAFLTTYTQVKRLAYDHDQIARDALVRLRERFSQSTIAQKLLPKKFTLTELYHLYCVVFGKEIDKRNFLKKIKALDIIQETGEEKRDGPHRPAQLYSFIKKEVTQLDIF